MYLCTSTLNGLSLTFCQLCSLLLMTYYYICFTVIFNDEVIGGIPSLCTGILNGQSVTRANLLDNDVIGCSVLMRLQCSDAAALR